MQYREVRALFFTNAPAGLPVPEVVARPSAARRLRDAFEPIGMHQVWAESVHAELAGTGLDFFSTYAWGRAAVLGDVEPHVAASTFAVFEPSAIVDAVAAGQAAIARDDLLDALDRTTVAALTTALGADAGADELAATAHLLATAVQAADGTGRPLFTGVRALGMPDDPVGRLWRSCHALREHRGDSHVAAFVAAGFDPVRMNILTELWLGYPLGAYSGSRRWPQHVTDAALDALRHDGLLDGERLTHEGHAVRNAVEEATDRAQTDVVAALGPHLDEVADRLDRWSARCIEAGAFPPDPRKRHAG
jgi:hypothetical protein